MISLGNSYGTALALRDAERSKLHSLAGMGNSSTCLTRYPNAINTFGEVFRITSHIVIKELYIDIVYP